MAVPDEHGNIQQTDSPPVFGVQRDFLQPDEGIACCIQRQTSDPISPFLHCPANTYPISTSFSKNKKLIHPSGRVQRLKALQAATHTGYSNTSATAEWASASHLNSKKWRTDDIPVISSLECLDMKCLDWTRTCWITNSSQFALDSLAARSICSKFDRKLIKSVSIEEFNVHL